jgi:hypothetical protein
MVLLDTEYWFAQGPSSLSGIQSARPRVIGDPQWRFRESLSLGQTQLSREEVRALIAEMKDSGEWAGNAYNRTRKSVESLSAQLAIPIVLALRDSVTLRARSHLVFVLPLILAGTAITSRRRCARSWA